MFKYLVMSVIAVCLASAEVRAATVSPPSRTETLVGTVRRATLSGTYTLAAGEVVDRVTFVSNSGTVNGTFTSGPNTYKAEMGAFDLQSYRVDVTIRNIRTGRRQVFQSQTYTWGK